MYNDYSRSLQPFDLSRASTHTQSKNQWSTAPSRGSSLPMCQPQPPQLSREFSAELAKRVTMRKKKKEMRETSIEIIKRKFEGENKQPQVSSSFDSYTKSNQSINNTLEETYWAQWKPNPSNNSSSWTNGKQDASMRGRTQFTACTSTNKCTIEPIPSGEGRAKLDEKSLKILRKPMDMIESNSSEGDKKLYICNPCDNPGTNSEIPLANVQNYQQSVPAFTVSMPNYHSIFYYGLSDRKYQNNIKPCQRKDLQERCCENRKRGERSNSPKKDRTITHQTSRDGSLLKNRGKYLDNKKRPKSVEKKASKLKGKDKQVKSDEDCTNADCPKNRVRFFTKKHSDESNEVEETESLCSAKDSSRTIDGYHGDVDTESYQVRDRKNVCCDYDSYEEEQETLKTEMCDQIRTCEIGYNNEEMLQYGETDEYDCPYACCGRNCCQPNCRHFHCEDDSGYRTYNHPSVYRSEEDVCYPNNCFRKRCSSSDKEQMTTGFCCGKALLRESSHSSSSRSERAGMLKVREPPRMFNKGIKCRMCSAKAGTLREKCCGTPTSNPKTAIACNTDHKICINRSCETLGKIMKEKKSGEDYPCCLKVIREIPEVSKRETVEEYSSSSKSDEYNAGCKCCSAARCRKHSSSDTTSSSTHSSKDTIAVLVDSSKEEIPDEETFIMDELTRIHTPGVCPYSQSKLTNASGTNPYDQSTESPFISEKINKPNRFFGRTSDNKISGMSSLIGQQWYRHSSLDNSTSTQEAMAQNNEVMIDTTSNPLSETPGPNRRKRVAGMQSVTADNNASGMPPLTRQQWYRHSSIDNSTSTQEAMAQNKEGMIDTTSNPLSEIPGPNRRKIVTEMQSITADNNVSGMSPLTGQQWYRHSSIDNSTSTQEAIAQNKEVMIDPSNPLSEKPGLNRRKIVTEMQSIAADNKVSGMPPLTGQQWYRHASIDNSTSTQEAMPQNKEATVEATSNALPETPSKNGKEQSPEKNSKEIGTQNAEGVKDRSTNVEPADTLLSSKSAPIRVHYSTGENTKLSVGDVKREPSTGEMKMETSAGEMTTTTKDAAVDAALQHGRSFDGIRHYRSQENQQMVFLMSGTERVNDTSSLGKLKDAKESSTMTVPLVLLPVETRNPSRNSVPRSLILQRSPRCSVKNRPVLKGHTYTLKTGSGRGCKSPRRKR